MANKYQDRVVRVFISSTFRDMHAEREELVKYTFPELRRRCCERGVEFVDVDLRWGVTEEQSETGEVLPICLAEIERCHPYFIGLLGERYGWIPEEIDQDIINEQPWLEEHREKSVTELEILHGVLENRKMDKCSFFYLRDEETSQRVETALAKEPGYRPEPEHFQPKLKSLKESIAEIPNKHYSDVKTLGEQILEDLWAAIDQQFPESEIPTKLEKTRLEHEAFAAVRRNVYIGKQKYFDRLDEHVNSDEAPLVILGESGSGKSALIANWVEGFREKHPDDFILLHFIGSSADSADHVPLLRRIMLEIKAHTEPEQKEIEGSSGINIPFNRPDEEEDIPTDPQKLIEAFPLWLAKAAAKGRFILILDGLNQLEDRDNAQDLGWLPQYMPPQVRLIVSTLPGRSLNALQKRDWPSLGIELLDSNEGDTEERKNLIVDYLKRFSKTLDESQIKRITKAKQSSNPLYLKTLLDELRVFGSYEKLNERIDYYLQAETIEALFDRMLERLEQDYDRDNSGLTKDVMSLIWASRRGMSETELLDLINIPQAFWSPLKLSVEESLVCRSGLLNFFHDYLRRAVQQRYLKELKQQQSAHLNIADYFKNQDLNLRKTEELPWHLQQAERWELLKDCITELRMFQALQTENYKYELISYWLSIGDHFDMVQEYQVSLDAYEKLRNLSEFDYAIALNCVANFLSLNARYAGASSLYLRAVSINEKEWGDQHPITATCLNNLASSLDSQGEFKAAELLYRRAVKIYESTLGNGDRRTADALNNLAFSLTSQKEYIGVDSFLRRALVIYETELGESHPITAKALTNLASLFDNQGDYKSAEPLYRRALVIYESAYGERHPLTALGLNNLASIHDNQGDYASAEPLYSRALAIDEAVLGERHPYTAVTLNNLAGLLRAKGDFIRAESLYRRALAIYDPILGEEHPHTVACLSNLAELLNAKGDYVDAESLGRQVLAIRESVLDEQHPDIATSLNSLAVTLQAMGKYVEAKNLNQRALLIRESSLSEHHSDTAQSLNDQAAALHQQGDYDGAEPLYRQALEIYETTLGSNHPYTSFCLNNLAELLRSKHDYDAAEPLCRRALEINIAILGTQHPDTATTLNTLALILQAKGDIEGAESLQRQSLEINKAMHGEVHPNTADGLFNLAFLLKGKGNCVEAAVLFQRALEIYTSVLGSQHSRTDLARLYLGKCQDGNPPKDIGVHKKKPDRFNYF